VCPFVSPNIALRSSLSLHLFLLRNAYSTSLENHNDSCSTLFLAFDAGTAFLLLAIIASFSPTDKQRIYIMIQLLSDKANHHLLHSHSSLTWSFRLSHYFPMASRSPLSKARHLSLFLFNVKVICEIRGFWEYGSEASV
jgi:hypothetical protein